MAQQADERGPNGDDHGEPQVTEHTQSEKLWLIGWWLGFRIVILAGAFGLVKLGAFVFARAV